MRPQRPLADWLDQPVRFVGYMETWKAHPPYILHLLRNVKVRLYWDPTNTEERHIDHLWLSIPDGNRICDEKIERLSMYHGCGKIISYQRASDGTFDYGIANRPMVDAVRLLWLSKRYPAHSFRALQAIERCQEVILSEAAATDWDRSVPDLLTEVEARLDHCRKQNALQDQYNLLQIQQYRGTVKRDPIKFQTQSLPKTRGFAIK